MMCRRPKGDPPGRGRATPKPGGLAPVAARTMRIERVAGGEELVRVYRDLLAGRADPAVGYVVSL
jgi:hypothetical protein